MVDGALVGAVPCSSMMPPSHPFWGIIAYLTLPTRASARADPGFGLQPFLKQLCVEAEYCPGVPSRPLLHPADCANVPGNGASESMC